MGGDDDEAEEGEDEDAGDIDDAPTLVEYEVDVYFLCFFFGLTHARRAQRPRMGLRWRQACSAMGGLGWDGCPSAPRTSGGGRLCQRRPPRRPPSPRR